jgi:hypothetical protein
VHMYCPFFNNVSLCSDDDFETKLLRCILPKPKVSEQPVRQRAAAPVRRQPVQKNQRAKSSTAASASAPEPAPAPAFGISTAAELPNEAAEHGIVRLGGAYADNAEGRVSGECSDWDEDEIARAVALSLIGDPRTSLDCAGNDDNFQKECHSYLARSSPPIEHPAADKISDAGSASGKRCSNTMYHGADEGDQYDEATITGGVLPPSPGQRGNGVVGGGDDDSILDISFHDDDIGPKPVSKRKSRIPSASARQQLEKQELETVEDVDFSPAPKKPRARAGSKASVKKVARSEEDMAMEQSETLSRKNMAAVVKSARLGLLRPGVAAECRFLDFA